jgi:hypothetical protein
MRTEAAASVSALCTRGKCFAAEGAALCAPQIAVRTVAEKARCRGAAGSAESGLSEWREAPRAGGSSTCGRVQEAVGERNHDAADAAVGDGGDVPDAEA